jgi:hypothetical protein
MNISDLRDLKLTMEEWDTLVHPEPFQVDLKIVDMLVLAGLVEWDIGEHARDEGEWLLTDKGRSARDAIDMIFDWTQFAHREDKPVEEQDTVSVLLSDPKHMTVGSLVRHKTTGGVGLITQHGMWDADWGSFRVQFNKPVDNVINGRVVNQLSHITDRADKFEFTY